MNHVCTGCIKVKECDWSCLEECKELRTMRSFLEKGYRHVTQFQTEGKDFGDPVCFKSPEEVGPFMRENKLRMVWTKKIEDRIKELGG